LKRNSLPFLGAQDTYYVGTLKGVGHIYQQSFIDTYSKVAIVKLYEGFADVPFVKMRW
jgi:hypothetical protein